MTKGQQAISELARAFEDYTGNLHRMPGIFPDYSSPIVRHRPNGRALAMARWGMPSSQFALMQATKRRAECSILEPSLSVR